MSSGIDNLIKYHLTMLNEYKNKLQFKQSICKKLYFLLFNVIHLLITKSKV